MHKEQYISDLCALFKNQIELRRGVMLSLLDSVISLNSVIWLFLIAFIIHDLEEIIFVESWMKKNYNYIQQKTPSLFKKVSNH